MQNIQKIETGSERISGTLLLPSLELTWSGVGNLHSASNKKIKLHQPNHPYSQPGCTNTYNCLLIPFPPGDLLILATVCPLALNNVLEEPEQLSTHGSWLSIFNLTSRNI